MTKTDELKLLGRFQMVLGGISLLGLAVLILGPGRGAEDMSFASVSVIVVFAVWLLGSGWGMVMRLYAWGFIAGSLLGVTAILFGGIPPFGFPGFIYGGILAGLLLLRYRPLFQDVWRPADGGLLGNEFDSDDEQREAEQDGKDKS